VDLTANSSLVNLAISDSRSLISQGHHVRVFARQPGTDSGVQWATGDLATGIGLEAALDRMDTVVHAATLSPIARRGMRPVDFFFSPRHVDLDGTRFLLAAAKKAGVGHVLFVSIVDVEVCSLPYSRVKLAAENLVKTSPVPWSVVRATPFFYLMARMIRSLRSLPVWLLLA
jgi:uncharacterized protein YbjT (DUF2867 family)